MALWGKRVRIEMRNRAQQRIEREPCLYLCTNWVGLTVPDAIAFFTQDPQSGIQP
jgi:hypothetical protein